MILAGDVGGTKTLLGTFEDRGTPRPRALVQRSYATRAYDTVLDALDAFTSEIPDAAQPERVVLGVAGPVSNGHVKLTNGTWTFDAAALSTHFGGARTLLLNDLVATAYAVEVLDGDELATLQEGEPVPDGNAALIAAGTGLNEAMLPRLGGRLRPMPAEAGHTDFAARTNREIALVQRLRGERGRVSVEDVVSGNGLVALHELTHAGATCRADIAAGPNAASAISTAALQRQCPLCVEALDLLVEAYGAEAGNLALRAMATAGVYVGGGIAPKILPALHSGRFTGAFRDKAPMADLVARVPIRVILVPEAALLGAAVAAATMDQ